MKSFLNYSKNRILYNIFRGLLVFLLVFLASKCNVKALITGESYSESATNKYMVARLYTTGSLLPLYGLNGTSNSCTSTSPDLNCFYKGNSSIFTYDDPSIANYVWTTLRFYISPSLINGKTYNVSMKYEVGSTIDPTNWFGDQENAGQGTVTNYQNTCTGANPKTCYVTFTMVANASHDYLDIKRKADTSVNGYLMIQQINKLYMPQVTEVSSSSGGGNTTIIIDNKDLENKMDQTNDKLDGIQDAITDTTPPNTSDLENSAGWLPAGPVDSILNLPLTLFQSLLDNLGSSCAPVVLPIPYVNKNLTLPCFNSIAEQIRGFSVWWNGIGVIASAFILYSYLLKLYKWVDDTLTFRENTWQDWGGV